MQISAGRKNKLNKNTERNIFILIFIQKPILMPNKTLNNNS